MDGTKHLGYAYDPHHAQPSVPAMSLRDYFAAKAMAAIWVRTATDAYKFADAMLAEREKAT